MKPPFSKIVPEGDLPKLQATEVRAGLSKKCKDILTEIDKQIKSGDPSLNLTKQIEDEIKKHLVRAKSPLTSTNEELSKPSLKDTLIKQQVEIFNNTAFNKRTIDSNDDKERNR